MRRRIVFALSSLAALAVVFAATRTSTDAPAASPASARVPDEPTAQTPIDEHATLGPRLAPVVGETWRLALRYDAETRGTPLDDGAPIGGSVLLDGELDLTVLAVDAARARFSAELSTCHEASVVVLSRPLVPQGLPCGDALTGVLVVDVDPFGRVLGARAANGQPSLGTRVLEAIVSELFVSLPSGFDVAERVSDQTPRGVVTAHVRATRSATGVVVHGVLDDLLAEARVPGTVAHTSGERHVELESGRISLATMNELLRGERLRASMTLDARLVDVNRAKEVELALVDLETAPLFATDDARMAARLTDERIAGLVASDVRDALVVVNAGGEPADLSRFLWRATALIGRDDELAQDVGSFAEQSTTTTRARALAVDLLAQAGSLAGERALLRALDSDAARADPHHALHVQRVAFVERPSTTMGEAVLARLEREREVSVRGAWLAGAGSVAASLDDKALVARLHDRLREGLASDGELLVAALLGVGNARSATLAAEAVPFTSHDVASVRAAALEAVVDGTHPLAAELVATAARDRTAMVQRAALRALDRHLAPSTAVVTVSELVEEQALRRDNVRVALDLLKHHGTAERAHAERALAALEDDMSLAGEERAAARTLRAALARGGFGRAPMATRGAALAVP